MKISLKQLNCCLDGSPSSRTSFTRRLEDMAHKLTEMVLVQTLPVRAQQMWTYLPEGSIRAEVHHTRTNLKNLISSLAAARTETDSTEFP